MAVRLAALGTALALVAVMLAAGAEEPASDRATFSLVRNKILLPVYFGNSGPYPFLLDSNAASLTVDSALAQGLRLPQAAVEGDATGGMLPELSSSDLRLPARQAITVDLSQRSASVGTALAGLFPCRVGSPSLTLDFGDRSFSFGMVPDTQPRYPFSAQLRFDEHGLSVDALFNGKIMIPSRLDTTYGATLAIPEARALELGLIDGSTPRLAFEPAPAKEAPLDGVIQARLQSLRVGGAEIREPLCTLLPSGTEPVVGVGFLRHFRVRLDLVEGALALAPLRNDTLTDAPVVGYGLVIGAYHDGYWTLHVAVNSPAYRGGIKSGDLLVSINGAPMLGLPYADVAARLAGKDGEKVKLGVMRDKRPIEATLTAELLL